MSVSVEFDETAWGRIETAGAPVVARITTEVEHDAQRFVPVDTGRLQRTLSSEVKGLTGRVYAGDPAGGVDYHTYQEFGTSKMQAQPYLRPALYRTRSL